MSTIGRPKIIHACGSSYDRGCTCPECRAYHRGYTAGYNYRREYIDVATNEFTQRLSVEADVPRQVIGQLRADAGMTYQNIGDLTGINPATLCRIAAGKTARVHRSTADALYALQAAIELERPDLEEKWYGG